ncbi:MAG: polysaccharide pyruvyl transferase CsaB [Chloroflexota bacterium]
MSRILISGYIGFGNSGDEGILMAMTQHLRAAVPSVEITVLSNRPAETEALYGVRAVARFNLAAVSRAIRDADLIINGGGSLLQDRTSSRSLFYYLYIIWRAKLLRKRVVLYANGIGPVRRPLNRRLTARILNSVDLITLRESMSLAELRGLGVDRPPVEVTADPVFGLSPAPPERARELLAAEGVGTRRPLVGVSVRQWANLETWAEAIAVAADHLIDRHGASVAFIPMEFSADVVVAEAVARRMRNPATIIRGKYIATDCMAIVGQLDLLLGMRLHSLIFAARQQVPLIGIDYDPKVRGLLAELGQPSAGDVASLSAATLIRLADEAMARLPEIRASLQGVTDSLAALARRNAELTANVLREGAPGAR